MRRLIPIFLLLLIAGASLRAQESERHSRVRIIPRTEADRAIVRSLDIDHAHATADGIVAVLTHRDLAALRAAGVEHVVEVAELERFYAERSARDEERMRSAPHQARSITLRNFTLGSVGGFYTVAELERELARMAELFPLLAATPEQIGVTHQGRPILAVRLSARPAEDQSVPEALFTAMHHAREPAGMMSLVYSMWSLLEGYGTDPEVTHLLDTRALWFIPLLNPDGYARNAIAGVPGGLWRKNMRAAGDSGVDLNRNYGPESFWAHAVGGSSVNRLAETYRGPAPFSEPETQAVRDFCLRRRFEVALNHHTFSNLFIQPEEILTLSPADSVYYKLSTRALAALAGYAPGNSKITVGYTTRGTSDDWMFAYGRQGGAHMFSWTPESGNGEDEFWPVPSRIEPICASNHRMNMGLAWAAGAAPMITAKTWLPTPDGPVVRVTVMNAGRRAMASSGTLELAEGGGVVVPALAQGEALSFDLPVPPSLRGGGASRRTIAVTMRFEGVPMRDSVDVIVDPVDVLFSDGFEGGLAKWQPTFTWGVESTSAHGDVLSDSPGGNYAERGDPNNEIVLGAPVSLANASAAELQFDASYAVEGRSHNAAVQIRREPEIVWEDAESEDLQLPFEIATENRNRFRGDMLEWRRYRVNLDRYLGSEISVRFVLTAQASQWGYTFDGIKLDDVAIIAARPTSAVREEAAPDGLQVMPNPFTSRLTLELGGATGSADIELYDALGRLVRTATAATRITLDTSGLPTGAYTVVVRRAGEVIRRRVSLAGK